jgi:hypothetical protein
MMMYGVCDCTAGDFSMMVFVPLTGNTGRCSIHMKALTTYPTDRMPNRRAIRKNESHTTSASTSRTINGMATIQSMTLPARPDCMAHKPVLVEISPGLSEDYSPLMASYR